MDHGNVAWMEQDLTDRLYRMCGGAVMPGRSRAEYMAHLARQIGFADAGTRDRPPPPRRWGLQVPAWITEVKDGS